MVIPGLACHLDGYKQAEQRQDACYDDCGFVVDIRLVEVGKLLLQVGFFLRADEFALLLGEYLAYSVGFFFCGSFDKTQLGLYARAPLYQTCHTHTYPNGKGVERTGIRVISFTGLCRGLVEVEHDSDTRHEEQEEDHPELLDTPLAMISLPEESD